METKRNGFVRLLAALAVFAAFAVFALCAAAGLVMTCSIDPEVYWNETILYKIDFVPLNVIVLAAVTAACVWAFGVKKYTPGERTVRTVSAVSVLVTFVLGAVWVTLVKCVPEFDSHYISHAAALASQNDFSAFSGLKEALSYARDAVPTEADYFVRFPFQLGYVTVLEGLQRLFGAENWVALGIVNAACLAGGYAALIDLTNSLFEDRRVRFAAALLPVLFLQGPLFCTFVYGNIPGFCCALWAAALYVRFIRGGRTLLLIPAAVLLAAAILIKPNYWIFLVACAIIAVLHLILEKKWQGLVFVLAAALLATGSLKLCTARYEKKAGTEFGPGTPQTAWLAMGMHGSYMAPGWYNGYTTSVFRDADYDTQKAKAQISADLKENLSKMKNPVYAAAFFGRKFLSQFEETSFESIFVSKDAQNGRHVPKFVSRVYGKWEGGFLSYFDQLMQLVYVFAAAGLFAAVRSVSGKKDGADNASALALTLVPVILFGGFLYHMLFEGKSQYILVYIPLLFPFAAKGVTALSDALARRFEKKKAAGGRP